MSDVQVLPLLAIGIGLMLGSAVAAGLVLWLHQKDCPCGEREEDDMPEDEYTELLQQLIAATQQHLAVYQQRQQGIPVPPELYRATVLAVEEAYRKFWLWPVD